MMHHEILSEGFFGEFYPDTLILQVTYIPVLLEDVTDTQKMIVLQNIVHT